MLLAILLMMFSTLLSKRITIPTGAQLEDLKQSGFFGANRDCKQRNLYKLASIANELHTDGKYHEAVRLQQEILESIYKKNNVDLNNHTPKFLSYYFGGFLGHRAFVGTILTAQEIGIINDVQRILPYAGDINESQLEILFNENNNIELIRSDNGLRFLEGPSNWHLSERLWMIKTKNGFMETQRFVDEVFMKLRDSKTSSALKLNSDYESKAQLELSKKGLPKGQEFVALHVRKKTWNKYDIRQAEISNYIASVKELLNQGLYVVQIGTDPQEPILNHDRIIVIQGDQELPRFLTPYVLSKCKFLINTSSGPSYLAALFGTPVLQTNVVAFGKSSPVFSNNSIHLPKTWILKGKKINLFELLNSDQGYSYRHLDTLNKSGFNLVENSSDEILGATHDILKMINGGNIEKILENEIKKIRNELKVPCNGDIAPSYLEKNQSWFIPNGII